MYRLCVSRALCIRLTCNMMDGMGLSNAEGVFRRVAEVAMGVLRQNKCVRAVLVHVLAEPHVRQCVLNVFRISFVAQERLNVDA